MSISHIQLYFLLIIILALSGCGQSKNISGSYIDTLQDAVDRAEEVSDLNRQKVLDFNNENYQGGNCLVDTDCILPGVYAIQSNCPYQAYCDSGLCVVGCPLFVSEKGEYDWQCTSDEECDCQSQRAVGTYIRCQCISDQCVAVVSE